ncbi:RNA-binding cell elongation regulator Jag/EloR [Candidatus Viridilinea mediisalina]|uniref:RNA-binding protein KhpB n=1 Tax=Candidatus Viridilinea mediisalina TaxID=2024553 RepID=A0A2A6RPP7_9CHLR|nr:RNA-binding cell elongation regulator Jag/EloR [Candidatus Viridilinea mediisalina]PDW04848.1 single-stranded DNA-binding protein [Candidatus Viridilinea mediisalina]
MKSIEISARTVAEAVELALAQLGKDRDEVAIAVLEPGEGGDEALVRVSVVDEEGDEPSVVVPEPSSEVQVIARQMLDDLLERMHIHAYVTPVLVRVPGQKGEIEETVTLHVEGADEEAMGLLIGRRGETLRSLQFLLNLLVSRRVQKWPQVVVDVGNYRQRRQESLEGLALRMAERVRQSGRPIMLEPMAAYERRIVHLALRGDQSIYTESSGEGENRKIVIYPAR